MRIFIQIVVPVLLPAALYALWLWLERRRALALSGDAPSGWREGPWVLLLAVGVALAAILTLSLTLLDGSGKEGRYVPPRFQDGRVVPGHVEPR